MTATPPPYAELHCLSDFSFHQGASSADELFARAKELGYAALAITDDATLAGIVRAHKAARTHGVPLIVGSSFAVAAGDGLPGFTLVVLATDRTSYGNLCQFITRQKRQPDRGRAPLAPAEVDAAALAGCLVLATPDRRADDAALAALVRRLARGFAGRSWIAVELLRFIDDARWLARLWHVAAAGGVPLVAATGAHMHAPERKPLQDALTAIGLNRPLRDCGRALAPNAERHLRERADLADLYPPELLAETLAIARRCRFSLAELRYEYPAEVVPAGETPASHLRHLVERGMVDRWGTAGPSPRVHAQIEKELALIAELGYEHYFLTVHDIVAYARSQRILCQGRGSAANSVVCYCLHITEVDPERLATLFERFISKERHEPPDIDVDFEHQRREEVVQYLYRKYGRDRAALAAAVITYRPRSALRDTGKALGFPQELVDRLAKGHQWWDGERVVPEALESIVAALGGGAAGRARLAQFTELAATLVAAGIPRHLSQHSGGFVLTQGPLERMVPIANAAMDGRTVIEWDKDDLDELGLMKVDVLALGMLSALRRALAFIAARRGRPFTLQDIPDGDDPTYAMLCRADTVGVFQVESRAQRSMLPRLRPKAFYDLVVQVAIVRPGPIQGHMVHPYLRNRELPDDRIHYENDALKTALERTRGVPIFQEQVMQIAQIAAGFSPGDADELRRAMASWRRHGSLEKYHAKLVQGMADRHYRPEFAEAIFAQIKGFSDYGFPESHAASFALLVYASAWIKCHEPAAFLAALLNAQPLGFYSASQLVQDARRHGVEVRPVDVQASAVEATLEETGAAAPRPLGTAAGTDRGTETAPATATPLQNTAAMSSGPRDQAHAPRAGTRPAAGGATAAGAPAAMYAAAQPAVRLGLSLVAGLSADGAARIVAARAAGPYASAEDLSRRARLSGADMRALAAADALAALSGQRRQQVWDAAAIAPLPRLLAETRFAEATPELPAAPEGEDIVWDYAALGLTLRRHPLALLRPRLAAQRLLSAAELRRLPGGRFARTCGIVTLRQRPGTAKGTIFVSLEDETGSTQVIVWPSVYEHQRRELLASRLLAVWGTWQRGNGGVCNLIARRLLDLTPLLGRLATESRDFH